MGVWTGRGRGGWGVGAGVRHLSSQFIAPDNVFEVDSYFVLDSALFYRQPTWEASLNVYNMTNEEFFTRGGAANNSVMPGDGVAMMGQVTLKF